MADYLGIDIGTSGVRAILINDQARQLGIAARPLPGSRQQDGMLYQRPQDWWQAVRACLEELSARHDMSGLAGICVDGTSGTTLLCDAKARPLTPALMYNDRRPDAFVMQLRQYCPPDSLACNAGSALAKAWWLIDHYRPAAGYYIMQQADWILAMLRCQSGISDWNNALKLGYDAAACRWPGWMSALPWDHASLPQVIQPGAPVADISPVQASYFGLPADVRLHAGTTDGVAAFIASGARLPGDAATSLGTTLVLKLCTGKAVNDNRYGVYSHRLDDKRWLAGGASNSGGAVLRMLFSDEELVKLSDDMDCEHETGLHYYPLVQNGERFPIADADFAPVMQPVPRDRRIFLQAVFEGIADIERRGYRLLEELGADPVSSIRTTGGGAVNPSWKRIRERVVGKPLHPALHTEAAYGSALLAADRL
jgi:sugar (pentulose or hexulose) kinase